MKTTIKFPKNDSFAFCITISKLSGLLDNIFFTVKENYTDETPVLQKSLGAGVTLVDNRLYKNQLSYKVQIDGYDSTNMEIGVHYLFDVKGAIGNAQKTFVSGELILSETETGYLNPEMQEDATLIAETYNAEFETGAQSQYVETESDPVAMAKIGDMTKLGTTEKGTIVGAINEVKKGVDNVGTPTFTEATARENIESGETQPTLWSKVKKWFSSLKALAFKDKVGSADFETGAKCPQAVNADYAPNAGHATNAENTDFTNAEWIDGVNSSGSAGGAERYYIPRSELVMGATYEVRFYEKLSTSPSLAFDTPVGSVIFNYFIPEDRSSTQYLAYRIDYKDQTTYAGQFIETRRNLVIQSSGSNILPSKVYVVQVATAYINEVSGDKVKTTKLSSSSDNKTSYYNLKYRRIR